MKLIFLLSLTSLFYFASTGSTECLQKNCVQQIAACQWDSTCIGIIRDCTSNKKCYDQSSDKMDWNCMTLCAGPKKNQLANKLITCGKTNCSNAVEKTTIAHNIHSD